MCRTEMEFSGGWIFALMRVRALVLVCAVVALLSGLALFSSFYSFRGGWLDGVFLVAVLVLVAVGLWKISSFAERSVSDSADSDLDAGLDESSRAQWHRDDHKEP